MSGFTGSSTKCATCTKTVYPMEMITANGENYHKQCFKCAQCGGTLKPTNFNAIDGKTYCKPHFMQLFALKGNYSMGDEKSSFKPATGDYRMATNKPAVEAAAPRAPAPKPDFSSISNDKEEQEAPTVGMSVAERMKLLKGNMDAPGGAAPSAPKPSGGKRPVFGGTTDKCDACTKTVYALEKIDVQGSIYHKNCFRCTQCKTALNMGNVGTIDSKLYCQAHYMENFKVESAAGGAAEAG
eukprot:CAMPEP_0182912252 /NCGR_PEP_ID=MMETSP0034_2-20130328/37413_1 /TAXON_ID=156128 /ORGANISM="Nephroselmis pyriformis, Strain CCMP717" /LENGTH=239 /DNA_ID=CAMNT_0025048911 /DNA_START=74 /DNA_END=789 /DNA_ORIENTATION=+